MDSSDFAHVAHGRALVADDDITSRLVLRSLLRRQGFEVIEAANGAQAIEAFAAQRPDIVFMDVVMPVMDGLEAATRIKALAGEAFVPILFVTGASADEDFVRCLDAGGDDFLVKPFSQSVLSAKIRAMERIRDLQARVGAMYEQIQHDQAMAKSVFGGAVMGMNVAPPALRTALVPASTFSGDLMLAAYAPSGDLYVLFGDFTGHGLAAALGALPTAEVFRAMAGKGFAPAQILSSINSKLRQLLPAHMFLAATFVHVARDLTRVAICNCGMPEAWIIEQGSVRRRIASAGLPLAICEEQQFEAAFEMVPVKPGWRVLLASDGVFEAVDAAGEAFGSARAEAALAAAGALWTQAGSGIDPVVAALETFRGGTPMADDVSLTEIVLVPALFCDPADSSVDSPADSPADSQVDSPADPASPVTASAEPVAEGRADWVVSVELRAQTLHRTDPVPLLISQMQEFATLGEHRASLYTVVTELYANALDHGLLGLDSQIKNGADGFGCYMEQRHRRFEALREGWVRLTAACHTRPEGPRYTLAVEDSGAGFDPLVLVPQGAAAPHGRGIAIVRGLCESLHFEAAGSRAVAVYVPGRKPQREA